jgi:arginine N-succinyltransferase
MDAREPSFLIREARPRDHRQLLGLARELDSINLPTDARDLRDTIARSARSFRGKMRDRSRAVYLFCAEEIATNRIAAASMIIGKHGTPQSPHYYLEMDSDERYSHTLRKTVRHTYLRLRYSMDGPTELGGLIVTAPMRGHPERVGQQISLVRYLYIAKHRRRFENHVVAEMLAPMTLDHGNIFWDHYGGKVTGLSFREADQLSSRDKEFIRTLFPESPLYTFLLPEDVRASLGAVGENTRGAVRLIEQAGMKFLGHLDPFDAGPYYGAATADLEPVKKMRTYRVVPGSPDPEKMAAYMLGYEGEGTFCAVNAHGELMNEKTMVVEPAVLEALGIKEKAIVDAIPLP